MQEPEAEGPSDLELVGRASRGDVTAFEVLVGRYQQAVYNVAYFKSRNCFDAEDLCQEIFLAAFRALGTLQDPDNFSGWLFGIAYNRCHKWYQRERTKVLKFKELYERAAREDRRQWARGSGSAAQQSERPESTEFLSRLPPDVREALTLKYLEGRSYDEISQRMGIKPHHIDYLIRKGKRLIRGRLGSTPGQTAESGA